MYGHLSVFHFSFRGFFFAPKNLLDPNICSWFALEKFCLGFFSLKKEEMTTLKRSYNELETNEEENAEVWVPYKQRRFLEQKNREVKLRPIKKQKEDSDEEEEINHKKIEEVKTEERPIKSLFDQKVEMLKNPELAQQLLTPSDEVAKEEEKILENLSDIRKPLLSVAEIANDIKYDKPMTSNWRPPRFIQDMAVCILFINMKLNY